jgi:uncharacterized membrane protein YphA (DoxX/SURF4 family)
MQKMNVFNATAVVPLLARLVLCAAFLTMGWNKLMHTTEFTGDRAEILIDLGIGDELAITATVTPASWQRADDADHDAQDEQNGLPELPPMPDVPDMTDVPEVPEDRIVVDPITGEHTVVAKRLHTVTLAVHNAGWAQPVAMAWIAAMTELLGGALLLIGLFSRVWGFGLAIAMGVAFYLTSLPGILDPGLFALAQDIEGGYAAYNRTYVQLSLGVLALGIALVGPGPLSLDRLLFRPRSSADARRDEDI